MARATPELDLRIARRLVRPVMEQLVNESGHELTVRDHEALAGAIGQAYALGYNSALATLVAQGLPLRVRPPAGPRP